MNAVAHIHPALTTSARVLWNLVLLPIVAVLLLLEPVVTFVCGFVMFGGLVAAVAFEASAVGPRFPFLFMLGFSLSFGAFLVLYHCLLMLLARD